MARRKRLVEEGHQAEADAENETRKRFQRRISVLESQKRHPDAVRARMAAWEQRNRQKVELRKRADYIKNAYGITLDEYQAMLDAQGGACAICKLPPDGKRLAIDHDHATGKVRGLLCMTCNSGIAHLKEDVSVVLAAARYLKTHGR